MTKPISHLRALCELAIVFALGFLAVVFIVFASGCKAQPVPDKAQVKPLIGIASAVSRADVRAATIIELAKGFSKFAPPDFAAFVTAQAAAARKELSTAAAEVDEAHDQAGKAQDQLKEANFRLVKTQSELAAEREQWFGDRTHRLVTWIITTIVAAWAILGALAVGLGVASPGGLGMLWSKRIIRFLPFANLFSWLRDRNLGARA